MEKKHHRHEKFLGTWLKKLRGQQQEGDGGGGGGGGGEGRGRYISKNKSSRRKKIRVVLDRAGKKRKGSRPEYGMPVSESQRAREGRVEKDRSERRVKGSEERRNAQGKRRMTKIDRTTWNIGCFE
jgi:hypothetical protein